MQPLDKNTLFSIFEAGDEEVYRENNVESLLDNPYVLMGMVVKGIDNWYIMDMMYKRSYPKEYARVRNAIRLKYYLKLYGYLERLAPNKFETVYTIGESFNVGEVEERLGDMLAFFESIEMYERCVVVKQYLDLLHHEYFTKDLLKNTGIKLPN